MTNSDDNQLTLINPSDSALAHVGKVANHYAAQNVFADYLSRKADNTIRRQAADLARLVEFLNKWGSKRACSSALPLARSRRQSECSRMDQHSMRMPGTA